MFKNFTQRLLNYLHTDTHRHTRVYTHKDKTNYSEFYFLHTSMATTRHKTKLTSITVCEQLTIGIKLNNCNNKNTIHMQAQDKKKIKDKNNAVLY